MTEIHSRCLDTFPDWLRSLHLDARDLADILGKKAAPENVRRYAAGGLNYLFKSLDLIPDGIEDLGFLDDAFVLRVAAALALKDEPEASSLEPIRRLSQEARLIEELLGKDYARLEAYVRGLTRGAARGRTVDEILADEGVRSAFLGEVSGWAQTYEAPTFARDEKNLIKLQSFLTAKLPA